MLRESISSILALSLSESEREIILVDDGSKQSPLNDLNEFKSDIIYIYKKNGGASTARNTGLKMARGKYIQFIDGDDKLFACPYEHCMDIMRFNDVDIVTFDFSKDLSHNTIFNDNVAVTGIEYLKKNNISGAVWGMLFKNQVRGDLQFTPGIVCVEDEEFTPQLILRAETIIHTDAQAYYYRQNPASTTSRRDVESLIKRLDDNEWIIFSLRDKAQTMPPAENEAMSRRVAQLSMDYIYNIIILTKSKEELSRRIKRLKAKGLFPLPNKHYSTKYIWFCRLSKSKVGLNILADLLSLFRIER